MPNYHYYQQEGGEEKWHPSPITDRPRLEAEDKPVFITVLSVSRIIEDDPESSTRITYEEKLKLAYEGPFYCDWDSSDELLVIEKVNQFLDTLVEMRVNLDCCRLYATGGRGYHLEIPQKVFMSKVPPKGVIGLPGIYREMAYALAVDTLDLKIYSSGRGRMWRTPNVRRAGNGRFKVSITVEEMRAMTPELCHQLTASPREQVPTREPVYAADLAIEFEKAQQKVDDLLAKRKRFKPDPASFKRAQCESIQMAMYGLGIKADAGFQDIATQLAIAATTGGISEDQFVANCEGLIAEHVSDSNRYNTPGKRREELRRMHRYMDGNFCYEFSVGAIKNLLTHSAPDLDGITISTEDLKQEIAEAGNGGGPIGDEYGDVASGIALTRHGIWKTMDYGKKRVCALSFTNSVILLSSENQQTVGYDTDIMVNGVMMGRQMLEMDVMSGLVPFNRLAAKYGHAFMAADADVRSTMMRFVEQAKKKGKSMFVTKREGLDVLHINNHPNDLWRNPFIMWSDGNGVFTSPEVTASGLELTFQGYPDVRGVFKTDIARAPALVPWLTEGTNKADMRKTLECLLSCQKPDLMGKLIGWYVSCFWKQLCHKVYGKFPLLHVNGAAGTGKSETNTLLASLFFYKVEARLMSPASTPFALQQSITASASIPVIIDEYKPQDMHRDLHNRLKLLLRDTYNQRSVTRGGGTRESDDYRSLNSLELSAPVVFIAEAPEEEAAVMERVVLATFSRPPAIVGLRNLTKFQHVRQNHEHLGILGQWIAANIVKTVTFDSFRVEFDALYEQAKTTYLLNEADLAGEISEDDLRNKQNAKERSVFNHTVARFGFQQFRKLVNMVIDDGSLDELMGTLEDGIYTRLADLNAATTPEHIKVLAELAQMSHHIESDKPDAIRQGLEYAFATYGDRDCVEIAIIPAYARYRLFCRNSNVQALFQGKESFMSALKDSPAFVKHGTGKELHMPQVYVFDIDQLARFSVDLFKQK